jgi:hypothetical protein
MVDMEGIALVLMPHEKETATSSRKRSKDEVGMISEQMTIPYIEE